MTTFTPVYTKQFAKDVERLKRRGKNFEKFKIVARALIDRETLDPMHRDHRLVGNHAGRRECHVESDWLLIYKIDGRQLIFERMGTHSDLFKK